MGSSRLQRVGIFIALLLFVGSDLFADFGNQELQEHVTRIQTFLFGPAMRLAGVMGGAYGLIQAVITSSIKPLVTYGGIGMAVNFMPKFIEAVFGS